MSTVTCEPVAACTERAGEVVHRDALARTVAMLGLAGGSAGNRGDDGAEGDRAKGRTDLSHGELVGFRLRQSPTREGLTRP
jgi:hypothetical protein